MARQQGKVTRGTVLPLATALRYYARPIGDDVIVYCCFRHAAHGPETLKMSAGFPRGFRPTEVADVVLCDHSSIGQYFTCLVHRQTLRRLPRIAELEALALYPRLADEAIAARDALDGVLFPGEKTGRGLLRRLLDWCGLST